LHVLQAKSVIGHILRELVHVGRVVKLERFDVRCKIIRKLNHHSNRNGIDITANSGRSSSDLVSVIGRDVSVRIKYCAAESVVPLALVEFVVTVGDEQKVLTAIGYPHSRTKRTPKSILAYAERQSSRFARGVANCFSHLHI